MTASLIAQYADCLSQLRAALDGLTETDLDLAPPEGGLTIRQIVHHVVDGDDLWKMAIKMALGKSDAVFTLQWYWDTPQVTWAENWAYARRAIEPSLALFHANRLQVAQLMQQIPDAWDRSITIQWRHRPPERVTAGYIVAMQAKHAMQHVDDIRAIRRARDL